MGREAPGQGQRLSRVLARAGLASRRGAEDLIRRGRVKINGRTVTNPAARWHDGLSVTVDGKRVPLPGMAAKKGGTTVVALHKPRGHITSMADPRGRPTVGDLLADAPRGLHPVGRLDRDSSGLILATDDGDLTLVLTHPRYEIPKTYHVTVEGRPSPAVLEDLRQGIPLADGMTAPAEVALLEPEGGSGSDGHARLAVTLTEGRNRQVRRMLATVGHPVVNLVRTAVGPIQLGDLPPGRWRRLGDSEMARLQLLKLSARGGKSFE